MNTMQQHDVVIAGAGVVGLSLALELRRRGRNVVVLERDRPGLASRAAAGMLAAHDPHNPPALQSLANLALERYPAYLDAVRTGSGQLVPIQTEYVLEPDPNGRLGANLLTAMSPAAGMFTLRPEQSLDPRELHTALRAAAENAGVLFKQQPDPSSEAAHQRHTSALSRNNAAADPAPHGSEVEAQGPIYVDCTGAWALHHTHPAKGQMLRIQLPHDHLRLPTLGNTTIRTESIYLVPRLDGSTVIGATVEDAGYNLTTDDTAMDYLRTEAAALVPAAALAPELERWSGLRPRTRDDLPVLGRVGPLSFVANGLFRNGILLAPAVAHVMDQLISGEPTSVPLDAFSPERSSLLVSR